MASKNRKDIIKAIRLAWLSLDSHLDMGAGEMPKRKCCKDNMGHPPFHRKCIQEYSEIIKTLSDCL